MQFEGSSEDESYDGFKNLDYYLDQIRSMPDIFCYWRPCAICAEWFKTTLTIAPNEENGICFCSTQCRWASEDSGRQTRFAFHDDERISYALNLVSGIPTACLIEHFNELQVKLAAQIHSAPRSTGKYGRHRLHPPRDSR